MYRLGPKWSKQSAVVISHSSGNVGMMLRELLRTYQWTVVEATPSVDMALFKVKQGAANLIIIDDSLEKPSSYSLRCLFSHPIACLTPMFAFYSEQHLVELNAMRAIGRPKLVAKPLTPDRFLPGFEDLIRQWSEGYFVALREAVDFIIGGDEDKGLYILERLNEYQSAQPLTTPCLAMMYWQRGEIKRAEKTLLTALKAKPRDLGVILTLSELYLHAALPELAYRILSSVHDSFNQSIAITPDLIQAAILIDRLSEAISLQMSLHEKEFDQPHTLNQLYKLLFAEGRLGELKSYRNSGQITNKISQAWMRASPTLLPTDKAG